MANAPDTQPVEEWRAVVGFEGLYEVSSHGRVKSLERDVLRGCKGVRRFPERIMRQNARGGYLSVELNRQGKAKMALVHRLVCEAWHGPPPSSEHQAAHGDGVRNNNAANNLRWATICENAQDRVRHGGYKSGEAQFRAVLSMEQVIEIRKRHSAGEKCAWISRDYPCSSVTVYNVVNRKVWKHI